MSMPRAPQVLSLSSEKRVQPRTPTRILGKPKHGALMFERFHVGAGRANDWIVNDIEIDGASQLSVKDLPGALFSGRGIVAGSRHAGSELHFAGLAVIERESEVAITVTYVGAHPEGMPFFGTIIGGPPPQRPTVLPIATRKPIPLSVKTTINVRLDAPLMIEMLEIENGREGVDWIVHDVRVDGASQFAQVGPIPGDMFSCSAIDSFVAWLPGKQIELDVEYIGLEAGGSCFVGSVHGTVVRDDLNQPPPDVRAVVHATNDPAEAAGEEVVAHCNWRA